jgi:formylaminopyrimidine deformylase
MMDDLLVQKRKVHELIEAHRDDVVRFLAEYVQHRSINPRRALESEPAETESCQRWLYERIGQLGTFESVELIPTEDEYNVLATLNASDPGSFRSLTFNGHSDVVPVTEEQYQTWAFGDPWSGEVVDGYLYGRGSADMKGGSAAFLWAANCLVEAGITLPGRCSLAFTIGEESGEAEIGPLKILADGYGADLMVVAEPTDLNVCVAAVGWFFFKVDVHGEAAHASGRARTIYPSLDGHVGANPIDAMGRILSRLKELELQWGLHIRHPLETPGTMTINPVMIDGGGPQATTPELCSATFAVVVSPEFSCEDALRDIEAAVMSVTVGDAWLRANPPQITAPYLQGFYEPVRPAEDSLAGELMLDAAKEVEPSASIALMTSPSDANFFAMAKQQTLVYGPGRISGDGVHGLDERIEVESLIRAAQSYASFIIDWCSTPKKSPTEEITKENTT